MAARRETEDDSAWELFHENSKNGRRLQRAGAREVSFLPASPARMAIRLPPADWPAEAAARAGLTTSHLSALLGPGPDIGPLVAVFVHVAGVDGLADGLYRHDEASNGLIIVRSGDLGARIAGALIETTEAPWLWLLVVGALSHAAALHGERGYRAALIAAGERIAGLGAAAKRLGYVFARPDFYDREIDALLGLDGLSEAVLAVLAVTARAG